MKKWPLSINTWGQEERDAAIAVLDSGQFTMHDHVREFETEFAHWIGSNYAVAVNSGSSANLLAVAALTRKRGAKGLNHGWEAIVPAIAWATTYAPLAQHGYKLRVCDIDLSTLNVDMDQVRAALTPKTKLVVGVSILGNPAPLNQLRQFANEHGLAFLEDNCESLGATLLCVGDYGQSVIEKNCGAFGDIGTHSFFFSHHLSTGEGGMLVTDDPYLRDLAICMRAHGWMRDLPNDCSMSMRPDFTERAGYRFLMPGYNVRPTEIMAAVGRQQLKKLHKLCAQRRSNGQHYQRLFGKDCRWMIQAGANGTAVPFGFTFVFQNIEMRIRVAQALFDNQIEYRLITGGSFAMHPAEAEYDWGAADWRGTPIANHAHECGLFIGNHPVDLEKELKELYTIIDGALS